MNPISKPAGHAARWLFPLALMLGVLLSCEYDHGVDPIRTRIRGNIIFTSLPAPGDVREVRVAVAKRFPPENLATDLIYSDPLTFSRSTNPGTDTVAYELVVEPATYSAAGVLWRKSGAAWDIANILGFYTAPGQLSPQSIVITPENPVAENVNILANWDLAKRDAVIEGTLTFKDEWPEDTEIVALAFFPIIPRTSIDFLTVKALNINVPKFRKEPFHYRTNVGSGDYKFITLFWKGVTTSLFEIRAVGFYHCPTDSLLPKIVTVAPGVTADSIDFDVKFSTLPVGVNYRKDGAPCPP